VIAPDRPGSILAGNRRGGPASVRKFFVERELPKIGRANRDQLRAAASRSNEALRQLEPRVQWIQS
jgi:hypothetical protein